MGPRVPVALGGLLLLAALLALGRGAAGRRETSFPEDTEADRVGGRRGRRYYAQLSDDEDLLAEEASGDGSGEDGSGTGSLDGAETPTLAVPGLGLAPTAPVPAGMAGPEADDAGPLIYFRALVNFTRSIDYGPRLEDAASEEFREVAEAVVDTLESEYYKIPGEQVVSVVFIKEVAGAVFVELDVGSEGNGDEGQIREVLRAVVAGGSIASYVTSEEGFQFRRLGTVTPRWRACSALEFACGSGECVEAAYRCDRRPDCRDASDEQGCGPPDAAAPATAPPATTATAPPATTSTARPATSTARPATSAAPRPPATGRPAGTVPVPASRCRPGEVACADRQCVPRDYLCDGERDCADGSDELGCGTPTPCEPNEFKCRNGHCALKLWRCDGDNDCGDGSDESDCPTKAPGDTCGPDQFTCVASRSCIPASYQCDEEPDCPDRSDEVGCVPPQVVTPPAEAVQAVPGQTVRFTCAATGVPTPIITWRLNWGHIPASRRVSIVSEKGQGTLTIRDVKEADQGAYTCEAINARGMVFGIPDGVLTVTPARGPCPAGHFHLPSAARCLPCFCFGVTAACRGAARHRHRLHLRFDRPGDFKGVTVTGPAGGPAPAAPQLRVEPDAEEFQLLDLSRRFLARDAFWALPEPFLGDKTDAYGGALSYAVRYRLGRGPPEPARRPDVVLLGAGRKLLARPRHEPARPGVLNQRRVAFTEDEWEDETGAAVSREQLLLVLQELRAVLVQAVYDGRQTSAGLSAVAMDVSGAEPAGLGPAEAVEECRCPAGYAGLSCQRCAAGFERVPHGPYLGSCSGCSCHGHASACDPVFGHCLSCQHNTEGPRCEKCRAGFFGDATQGTAGACRPCPCPYAEPARRFSESCFLDTDGQATCDACAPGYAGRRCERCAPGFEGDPIQPGGKCTPIGQEIVKCDERGGQDAAGGTCRCKPNVTGRLCDECAAGAFHLSHANPDGCLKCFCMGVSRQCASSSWHRDQVRAAPGTPFSLTDLANARTVSDGVRFAGPHDVVFSAFHALPRDVYFWVLPPRFTGDKVTSYGGELRYTVSQEAPAGARPLPRHPDVLLRGNGIALEHFGAAAPAPGAPAAVVVPFREHAWRRADGREATREHLLMALADVDLLMIRASYWEEPSESRLADLRMDVAVPHATGLRRALEVEDCACPDGYRGPSCQDCAAGFTRAAGGLYLGTCERCRCHGHADECHPDTGVCQDCRDHTEGAQCDKCQAGYYGDATRGTPADCQPCPCHGPPSAAQETRTCFADADGQPTCSACAPGYAGRLCERCSPGFAGDPLQDRPCREPAEPCQCDPRGSLGAECDAAGLCRCKANAEGPRCSSCRPGHFHLSAEHRDGCLPCFCMGVAQQCAAAAASRAPVSTPFAPGAFQGFALVNRQRSARVATGFGVETGAEGPRLTYGRFGQLGRKSYYWQLPQLYLGDKVGSYGGRLRYTLAYTPGGRGAPLPDADVQITGNDITLVAYQPELPPRAPRAFEVVFREQHWQRPDGQPATREHLMMALADLDEILIRATYSTNTASSSIAGVSMETAVPAAPGLPPAPEVEECRCPPGYRGLSCQDCAPGYTRTGGGLYLGHCELCECNGHSDACHPETGACSGCLHHTAGDSCERCSPGFYGDATAGTPEDCQPCACPLLHPENQFSRTCESLGAGGYRCTACEPGYAGQYCEQCAPGYAGDPNVRGQRCLPVERSPLAVRVHPPRTTAAQGSPVTLHCQASGDPPFYYYWSREDGRPLPGGAQSRREGEELHFASIQPSEAGVYVCSCRNLRHSNASRAEVIVTEAPSKPITVTVEEKRVQRVKPGADVTFICTAKSKSPAYTLVWTRQNHGKLPSRAMDFNGILTIRNVQPEDAGVYVCTGSNMLDMDEGTATLYVQAPSKTQMFYGPVEFMEGHRPSSPAAAPSATVEPAQLSVAPGQPAEFRCVATGSPAPAVEWLGGAGGALPPGAVVRGGILRFPAAEPADEAHYLCRARNSAGQHTARAVLRVRGAGAPQVQVSPERAEVHEGSTVRLYCRVSGSPDATVAWEKQGGALPPQSRSEHTDIATLVIPSIAAAHGGVYLCVGTSAAGTARAKIDVVVVPGAAPPVRVESPSPSVAEGQTLDLDCVVAGQGQATVTWYKRGGSLPAGHQVSGTRLRIPRVTAADSGEYVCRVASAADAVQEASFFVTVYAPGAAYPAGGAAPVRIESPSSPVLEGQTLELNCDIGEGQTSVMWYKRSGSLPAHHQVSGSRLRIPHVTAADAGEYVCRVSTGAAVREASIVVTVKAGSGSPHGPAAPGVAPPIRIEASSSAVAEGQSLELNCVVASPAQATVTWYKRGGSLPAKHQVSGSRLRLLQVTAADSGEYVCRVSTEAATKEASVMVTIQPSGAISYPAGVAPPVRIESSSSSVAEGQTLDLNCVVAGPGQATVTWYKRGGSLPAKHQLSGSRLRLSQLSVADSGEYVCRVGSGSSTREATIAVTVSSRDGSSYRLQSPIISIDPHSMAVAQGEDATFKCRIHDGARPINVTWRMGPGQHLQDNVKISPNGSVISIAGAHAGNQGAYHCVASNRFGIASSVVNLLVQGAPTVSVMPPGPVTVKEGKSISLECLGRGEPRPLVRWSRAGSRQKVEHQTLLHMDSQAVLQLAPAKAEHAGTYVCTAHNALGSAQAQVAVSVETAQRTPGAPEVVVSPAVTVVAGDTATLSCSATGEPAPTVEWSKLRAPLPWQHRVLNGTLVIPRAAQQDSGQYICNASNAAGFAEAFVTLDVETPPYATVLPEESAARAGETLQLQCLAHGTPPLRYHWAKVNGSLPARAARRDGLLRLGPALPDDAGTYRCLVSNRVGAAEAFARVAVHGEHPGDGAGPVPAGPPTVRVTPQSLVRGVGGTAEFACAVDGDPRARVEWLKDGGELPPGSSVRDGVLRISDLDRKSQGTYTCRASSPGGQAEGSATLAIQALPRALINIRTAVQTVLAGTAVELECLGLGEPKPHVTWSKVGGRIRPGVLVSAGTLRIERVERSDAGQYRCTAANAVGAVQSHVILHVQAAPQIAGQPEVKEVSVGSAAVFPCLASGFPVPEVKWSKLEGELPEAARVEGTVLTLPAVRPEDAGVYVCAASNRQGQETAFSVLRVRERLVPYFTQTPRSFLPLPTIKDAYKKFEIQITFRPDVADGMLLYNGQRKSSGADFVSFGLVGGRPEFRFDAGSGMATIRHPTPLRLGEYHTVRLFRNLTQGSLALDGFPPVNGTSQGKFQGLDLNEELYLGGYPDYGAVAKTGLRGGFVGCVRQLLIQGEEVVFGEPQLRAHGVADCPTCRDRPCQNGGVCEDTESSAYVCRCPPGFTGSNCEYSQALHCHPEACGPDATCVNRPDGQGYTCRCHLGKSGEKCMDGEAVSAPSFDGEGAFISYPPLTNIHHELRVDAEFKPLAPDGLLLFSGGKAAPVEDFVALAMADGHLEFRYELGSGPAVLRSPEPLALGRWHRVSAERLHKDGTLVVDGGPPVKRSSPGKSQGLNLRTPLYLGGVEPSLRLPGPANVSAAFRGCIGEVSVNGKKVDVSYSFLQSRGVAQCRESSPCERAPCRHGGRCVPAAAGAFRCLCRDGFSGPRCELADDRCLLGNPCLHGGTCKANACLCAEGFAGAFCQHGPALAELDSDWAPEGSGGNGRAAGPRRAPGVPAPRLSRLPSADAPGQFGASFRDGGYLALPGHLFARGAPGAPETVALEVRTGSADGVLLWHGAEPGDGGKAKDFIGLGLRDGHLVFSYQLGSGEATIVSEDPVNDGEWHRVTATREGRRGWLQVDGEEPVYGESPGTNIMANTEGNIYLGGAPDPRSLTAGKFVSGITGCLRGLVLAPLGTPAHPIDLRHRAAGGTAVPECPS
ncbi:basement membrane-specific heparan sulfate proteoglycan core protein isoform X5 [Dromaius novaehollandiae]|uniref:basement membrane-specific heparan sulfate proteoglycan core protein isoform X5 n=1 Tax=Dromaius novaehollandiae TaxID=8790 RepID=UPI00311ED23A